MKESPQNPPPHGESKTKIDSLLEHVARFPESPGVYIMKNNAALPIYIGKAVNLRSRVRSYFTLSHEDRIQIPVMLRKLDSIDWIATHNETEALILEANLIRKHKPNYNVDLRDDKHFPYLKVTVQEPFPRLLVVRRVERDGAKYFGPYTDVMAMRRIVTFAKRIFKLRDCSKVLPAARLQRPCINFAMKRCSGACAGKITQAAYHEQVTDLLQFLAGRRNDLIKELGSRMEHAAAELRFEAAGVLRDQLKLIKDAAKLQQVDLKLDDGDSDIFGLAEGDRFICMAVLHFREGLLANSRHFVFKRSIWESSIGSHDNLFLQFYLTRGDEPPPLICIPEATGFNHEALQNWLNQAFTRKIELVVPQKGSRKLLVSMAEKNAQLFLKQEVTHNFPQDVLDLQKALQLPDPPEVIEAFDISNLGASFTVAGMVQFRGGRPHKAGYRRFKIKTVDGQNDFAMMMEVVTRRLRRLYDENKPLPDLLLIDGGPGQLHAARAALQQFEKKPFIASLAKREEILYAPHLTNPVQLPQAHPARKLVERIRDEVHRYAITYHRTLRGKQFSSSQLEKIEGVGKVRAAELLKRFGSVKRIREAGVDALVEVNGISEDRARVILQELGEM